MQKAALLVKEGRDNEKFESTPEKKRAYIAYRILHNPFYYWTALILAVALMLMAAFEQPSTFTKEEKDRSDKAVSKGARMYIYSTCYGCHFYVDTFSFGASSSLILCCSFDFTLTMAWS